MDDGRVGKAVRAVRRRRGLRQEDVAARAGVHQTTVSKLERGRLDMLTIHTIRSMASVLDVSVAITPRWGSGDLDRLLDAKHAELVEAVTATLRPLHWTVLVEFTFSHYGERGSVDVVAWQPAGAALLLVEVKSRLVDLQDLLATTDRKRRLVPGLLAAERGWRAASVGSVVVLPEGSRSRNAVARHGATIGARFPGRTTEVRRWLADPREQLAAVWFLPPMPGRHAPGRFPRRSELVGGSTRAPRAQEVRRQPQRDL
jgi:transcriptional regulator with XRE-family HTH domain